MTSGWSEVLLRQLLKRSEEWVQLDPLEDYREVTVKLWGKGAILRRVVKGADIAAERRLRVRANQFILSRIDARNGAIGIVPSELDGAVVSNDFPAFTVDDKAILPEYLGWLSKTERFVDLCKKASEGTTNRVRLQEDRFLSMPIHLPPLPTQRRLVALITAVSTQIQKAIEHRHEAAKEGQAILDSARSRVYDSASEMNRTRRLEGVCRQITDGTHVTPRYTESGVPFLSVKDITGGTVRFDACRYISEEQHAILSARCKPEHGDVLLTKVGTTGYAKAIDVDREFSIFVSLALLKLHRNLADPLFIEHMLNSPRLRAYSSAGTRGVGNQNLVLKFIRAFPVPILSLEEQRRFVAALEALKAQVTHLGTFQSQASDELDTLVPAILARTFSGGL
ncbi:MAG: restriction endonuclease subunit S [Candidatus Coatesbacteria bacterium]